MVNYQHAKIYQVINDVNDIVYIGSTCQMLCQAMAHHRQRAVGKLTRAMNEIGSDHFRILLIKSFPCNSKDELQAEVYNTVREVQGLGIEVYNKIIDGLLSADTRPPHIAPRGDVDIGRISYSRSESRYSFTWCVNGVRQCKYFKENEWGGEWGARKMAECWRDNVFPIIN